MANKLDMVIKHALDGAVGLPDMRYILTVNFRGYQMRSISVVSYRHSENYIDNIFEAVMVDAIFSASDYSGIMMSGHEDITAILETVPYAGGTSTRNKYRAILLNSDDQRIEGNTDTSSNLDTINTQSFAVASFQLMDTAAYDLRMRQVGGIFTNVTPSEVLKFILSKNMLHANYSNQENISSISFDDECYPKKYSSVVIPEGTKLVAVGDYLQEKYGIYTTGFGIYLKNKRWFVYSPYNVVKGKRQIKKLVLINAPVNKYSGVEHNFKVEGNTITIVCTGETSMLKTSDTDAMNKGTGTRFADASKLISFGTSDPTDPKPSMHPKEYISEYKGIEYNNSFNNTQMVQGRFSSNPAVPSSKMAASAGTIINTVWNNGLISMLTPAMPVEFIYGKDDKTYTLKGTLLKAELVSSVPSGGIVEPRHRNTVTLSIFLKGG